MWFSITSTHAYQLRWRSQCLIVLFAICFAVLPALAAEESLPDEIKSFAFRTPPEFGYFIGDVLEHRIDVTVAKPYLLVTDHLPKPGPRNRWLNVRTIEVVEKSTGDGRRYSILVSYQLFKGVKKTTALFVPPVTLKFNSGDSNFEFATPEWGYSIASLIPDNLKDNEVAVVLGVRPELFPVKTHLGLTLMAIIFLCGYLAWLCDWVPFLPKRAGPFSRAYREIKKQSRGRLKPKSYETSLKLIHRAINQTVGATVSVEQLDDYCLKYPMLAESRNGLHTFFRISHGVFLEKSTTKRQEYPLTWLESFCQNLSLLEKKNS